MCVNFSTNYLRNFLLSLVFLCVGLLMIVSCKCTNPKLPANKKPSTNRQEEPILPTAHLVLSSNRSNLEKDQTTFEIFIKNESDAIAKLAEYDLKVNLQEDGGPGSTLTYTDATHNIHPALSIQQPLSRILQQDTLQKGNALLRIPFQLQPLPGVKKIIITLLLEHQHKKDQVIPLTVSWDRLAAITDAMIQLAHDKNYPMLSEVLARLQRGEVIDVGLYWWVY